MSQKGFRILKSVRAQGDIPALMTYSSFQSRATAASTQRVGGHTDEGEPKTATGTKHCAHSTQTVQFEIKSNYSFIKTSRIAHRDWK